MVRQILKADRLGRRNIDETLTFYRLPRQHHKHLKSTNMLERLNEEIRRRTHVVRVFPNGESCLRLVRALAVETHENWLGCGARRVDQRPSGIGQSARRKAIAGSAAVTAASSSTNAAPAF